MARTTSYGTCALCGYHSSKGGLTRHLKSCPGQHDQGKGKSEKLLPLRLEDAESLLYWLDLEIKASATLRDLDQFLRDIWLECCGHLSMFKIGNTHYNIYQDEDELGFDLDEETEAILTAAGRPVPEERDMDVPIAEDAVLFVK
jgi:hypothetical protein